MKRLFTLMLTAFIFAFTAPVAMHNAVAADEGAATEATDNAMKGDHHDHGAPANESNKTNKDKGRKHPGHHKGQHHKHKHMHKKADKGADTGADTGK